MWDRYDVDGDGNFREPDGFIDHFQIVHAGGDQAAGDPHLRHGRDLEPPLVRQPAARSAPAASSASTPARTRRSLASAGGAVVPNNATDVWVGDYTIQPENGGLGVFAHEYAHDLGLPDLYDTSGNTGGAENTTAFWTLMSSGANIGDGGPNGIGDAPDRHRRLGEVPARAGSAAQGVRGRAVLQASARRQGKSQHKLGPNDARRPRSRRPSSWCCRTSRSTMPVGSPRRPAGRGSGRRGRRPQHVDDAGHAGSSRHAAHGERSARRSRSDWDYAFLEASTNGGSTWMPVIDEPVADTGR